jgi:hypothetical protein
MLMSRFTDYDQIPNMYQTSATPKQNFQNLKFQNVKKKQETNSTYFYGNISSFEVSLEKFSQPQMSSNETNFGWNQQQDNYFVDSILGEEDYNLFGSPAPTVHKKKEASPWTKSASIKSPSKEPTPFSRHYGFPSLFSTEEEEDSEYSTNSFFSSSLDEKKMKFAQDELPYNSYPPQSQQGHYFNPNAPSFVPKTFSNEEVFSNNFFQEPSSLKERLEKKKVIFKPKEKFQDSQNGEQQYKSFSERMKELESTEDVVELAEEYFQISPKAIHWKFCLDIAERYKKSNNVEQATIWYSHVNQMKPYHPQGWIDHAKIHEDAGNLEECQKLLTVGLSYCPYNENLLIRGIKFYEQRGNLPAARAFLSRLRQIPLEKSWKIMLEGALLEARAGNVVISRKIFQYLIEGECSFAWTNLL